MKRLVVAVVAIAVLAIAAVLPLAAAVRTWNNVTLIDKSCSGKFKTDTAADAHTVSCALACASSGFGILTPDGKFLAFDKDGSQKAADALKATTKKDHVRATVSGEMEGDTIKVQSLKLD